jgi:hypothetical protein
MKERKIIPLPCIRTKQPPRILANMLRSIPMGRLQRYAVASCNEPNQSTTAWRWRSSRLATADHRLLRTAPSFVPPFHWPAARNAAIPALAFAMDAYLVTQTPGLTCACPFASFCELHNRTWTADETPWTTKQKCPLRWNPPLSSTTVGTVGEVRPRS